MSFKLTSYNESLWPHEVMFHVKSARGFMVLKITVIPNTAPYRHPPLTAAHCQVQNSFFIGYII